MNIRAPDVDGFPQEVQTLFLSDHPEGVRFISHFIHVPMWLFVEIMNETVLAADNERFYLSSCFHLGVFFLIELFYNTACFAVNHRTLLFFLVFFCRHV